MSSKIQQAQEHLRNAEKSLKTSLLKWTPEYDIAAGEYEQAATCFRNAKDWEQCKGCWMKAADCYKEKRALFHAGRCFEHVILILRDQSKYAELESLAHRACRLYQQSGSPEAAASALNKSAKMIETVAPELALNLYQHAIEVVTIEDSSSQGAEYASKVSRLLVRLKMYDQAADSLRREIHLHLQTMSTQDSGQGQYSSVVGRLTVALVLVQLARGDTVAAEKAFREWGNYADQNEIQIIEQLIQAYEDEDADLAKDALASPFIRHMDVDYAKLARDLKLPEGIAAPKSNIIANAAPSYISKTNTTFTDEQTESKNTEIGDGGNAGGGDSGNADGARKFSEEDDIEEGGLC